jgi:hypothetical protein
LTGNSWNTSDNRLILFDERTPISISECQLKGISARGSNFPFPDISAVTYYSDGKNLSSTLWLARPTKTLSQEVNDSTSLQLQYGVVVLKLKSNTLSDEVKNYIGLARGNLSGFDLVSQSPTTLAHNQAYKIVYTYRGDKKQDGCTNCKSIDILSVHNHKLYVVSFFGEAALFPHYLQNVQDMTSSIEIGTNLSKAEKNGFKTYEDSTNRLKIQYPSLWKVSNFSSSASFSPALKDTFHKRHAFAPIRISLKPIFEEPRDQLDKQIYIKEYVNKKIDSLKLKLKNFQAIEVNSSIHFQNHPAYSIVYRYNDRSDRGLKVWSVGAILGDDKEYTFSLAANETEFNNYLPIAQKMFRSFQIDLPTSTYENKTSNFRIQYLHNWALSEGGMFASGYSPSDVISSVSFSSPIKGPYTLFKTYRMSINYDSPYGTRFVAPYSFMVQFDSHNNTWSKKIAEISPSGQIEKILYNETRYKNMFEDKGFVPFVIDLDSLHLPDQFYFSFSVNDVYLKDGKMCSLSDDSELISSPPPIYFISTSPASLKDARQGDEKDVQIQIKSTTTLPFDLSLSAKPMPGLELAFKPNKTTGVPNDLTTSDLHIKILPNATLQTYSIPISANIFLTPTYNINNLTSASITKNTNFTFNVSPQLTPSQQFSESWNTLGSPINGFIGTITAVIGIGGIVGGWFLRKSKRR